MCASFIDENCAFRDGVYGFYTKNSNIDALYVLLAYFNSKFSTYYLFMTNSSYGIEREQIMMNEYLTIPINLNSIHYEGQKKLDTFNIFNIPDLSNAKKVLIIDDIIDSGETMQEILIILNDKYPNIEFKIDRKSVV